MSLTYAWVIDCNIKKVAWLTPKNGKQFQTVPLTTKVGDLVPRRASSVAQTVPGTTKVGVLVPRRASSVAQTVPLNSVVLSITAPINHWRPPTSQERSQSSVHPGSSAKDAPGTPTSSYFPMGMSATITEGVELVVDLTASPPGFQTPPPGPLERVLPAATTQTLF